MSAPAALAAPSTPTGTGLAVMVTYLLGQYLLATGVPGLAPASEG